MLKQEFKFIKENLKNIEIENIQISKGSVGWHFDHSLKVINSIFKALNKSNPKEYKKEINLVRFFVFLIGFFPRGKVKSPKRVLPPEIITKEEIERQLNLAIKSFSLIDDLEENQYFEHPIFKHLNKKKALKFLKLHTNHHLKIVKDVLK